MIRFKNAESMIWIVVWVFILWFTLMWIINILNFSQNTWANYEDEIYVYVNESNANNIIKKIDTSVVWYQEEFYIHKDNINKEFKIYTGSTNLQYSFIDKLWNLTDPIVNIWKTFKRIFYNKVDVLKHIIQPKDISNIVFRFDANNIDWNYNSWMIDWQQIWTWNDLSWNSNTWTQNTSTYKPTLLNGWINGNDMVNFSWSGIFEIADNAKINTDNTATIITYKEKSFAIVLKTWFDVISPQTIYEQWGWSNWYSFMIHSWSIYAWVWNTSWPSWHEYKSVNLWEVIPDSVYFVMVTQDSTNADNSLNTLKIYINWVLISTQNNVAEQTEHLDNIWIWAVYDWTNRASDYSTVSYNHYGEFFDWWIWELISWNHALSENEIRWIENYFMDKWMNWNSNVIYDTVEKSITKYNK